MDKEKTIRIIKERIILESIKHKNLDWEEIAARKIYASLVKLFAIPDVSKLLKCDCKHSGSCRYEEVVLETKELCRYKE